MLIGCRTRLPRLGCLLVLASLGANGQPVDEVPPSFTASSLLAPDVRKGPHHTVREPVETVGFFHRFSVTSDYGELEADGRSQLDTRLDEVRAIAALEDVSKSEVFLKSAGGTVLNIGKSTAKAVTDPVETAKGVGAGVTRLGVNLGRMAKRSMDSVGNESESAAPEQNAGEGAANAVLGVSGAMRRWARKVGADPYTTNHVLFEALKDFGRIDAAGSIATKVAVPVPAIVTTSASVADLVWSKDPEELRKINEGRLKALGVTHGNAQRFFQNRGYTLTSQTRFIAALDAVKSKGAAAYVETAAGANGERAALFFVESAEMLQSAHAVAPVTAILEDLGAMVALQGTRGLVLLPLDYVVSNAQTREVTAQIEDQVTKQFGVSAVDVRLTGRASARFRKDLVSLGWTLEEQQPRR